jgi:hypothetical protein
VISEEGTAGPSLVELRRSMVVPFGCFVLLYKTTELPAGYKYVGGAGIDVGWLGSRWLKNLSLVVFSWF